MRGESWRKPLSCDAVESGDDDCGGDDGDDYDSGKEPVKVF